MAKRLTTDTLIRSDARLASSSGRAAKWSVRSFAIQVVYGVVIAVLAVQAFSLYGTKDDSSTVLREATPVHYLLDRRYFHSKQGLAQKKIQDEDRPSNISL